MVRLASADGKRIVRAFKSLASLEHGHARVPEDGRAEVTLGAGMTGQGMVRIVKPDASSYAVTDRY
jgi:hypothetical protein